MLRVLHLAGSAVSEFYADLSRLYAADCLEATHDPARYETHIAYVTPDLRWRFPADLSRAAIDAAAPMPVGEAVQRIAALELDAMVPQMFCIPGMTHYRALFDVLGVPYVGNTPDVMALAANKARTKAVVAAAGVPTPRSELLRPGDQPAIGAPAVVKPVDADNSLGVAMVRDPAGFPDALRTAFAHGGAALVEEYVELGREVRCGIVVRDSQLVCLPLEEYRVDPEHKPIRDHDDKIARGEDGDLRLVAKDQTRAWIVDREDPITERVWDVARRCHGALGCRDYSLFDFRVDPSGEPWFLEASLYCSFARQSVLCAMAAAAGMSAADLFDTALASALEGGERMKHVVLEPIGVEVTDLPIGRIGAEEVARLKELLAEHGVLILPGQHVDDAGFVAFLKRFGELTFTKGETAAAGFPDLNVVSNVGRTTPPKSSFHVDTSYVRRPPAYTALRAVQIPAQGGETLFTNQYRALETLPADVREHLDGRTIRHVVTGLELGDDDETAAEHPVFRPHPITGRRALYLSTPKRCAAISGMDDADAAAMVAFLIAHATTEENTYRHRWSPGDVVMWDNACVLHRGDHSDVVGDRVMHRGMVAG